MQAADVAMYQAKAAGGTRYEVYEGNLASRALERLGLEAELRRAVEHGEFEVHYQPEVELATGRIAAVEALVRWRHPTRGLLPPSDWLGLAEETGLVVPIGRWVLEQACRQVRQWQLRYPSEPPLGVDVNLSSREILRPELVAEVRHVLKASGLSPVSLELEITESVAMADAEAIIATLRELDALGVRLAIDDFGTGYSSLAYLKRFPVDTIKIDKSFADGLDGDAQDSAIVRAVLLMGRALGLRVVAEGAETPQHLAALRALGCELAQGYYLGRPLPAGELESFLSGDTRLADSGRW
jgi:EAL domain-containing protein (putative c-di-GMP-specific phosphodiesterase class I)